MRRRTGLILIMALAACEKVATPPAEPAATAPVQPSAPEATDKDEGAYAMLLPREPASPSRGAIIDGEWIYDTPSGAGWLAARLPPPEIEGDARHYRLKYLRLTIEPGACADPRLRPTLPDRVAVASESMNLSGCGGPRQAPAGIADTHWQVLRLGAEAAPGGGSPTILAFGSDGGLGGTHACNDVGIAARWVEGRFVHPAGEPWIQGTLVGCEGPDVDFGARFWSAMHKAASWQRSGDRLRILFAHGSDAELRLIL